MPRVPDPRNTTLALPPVLYATPLDAARSQVGVVEEPRGSNRGVPFDRYALPGEDPLPWCSRFMRWCWESAGQRLPGNRYLIGRVETLQHELELRGGILRPGVAPEPGDLIFYADRGKSDQHKGGRHIGIVEIVGGLTLVTIEGNWSDAVVRRPDVDRYGKAVWCFGRWPVKAEG